MRWFYVKVRHLEAFVSRRSKAECHGHQFDFRRTPGTVEAWLPRLYMSVSWSVGEQEATEAL